MSQPELVPLSSPAMTARLLDILLQSFGGKQKRWEEWFDKHGHENFRVLQEDDEVLAGLGIYRMGQFFGGRSVPMAGIAAVGVPPELRGRGHAKRLMTLTLQELRREGVALSALFPSTTRVYRAVGYEHAGMRAKYTLPVSRIGVREDSLPLTRVEATDHERFTALYEAGARAGNGLLDRTPAIWDRVTKADDERPLYAYLAGEADRPRGYVIYEQVRTPDGNRLEVRDLVAADPTALRALWSLLASNHTLGKSVSWMGAAVDVRVSVLPEQDDLKVEAWRWMLRLVDMPQALVGRGYPEDLTDELHLHVTDAQPPENEGDWVLSVAGGEAQVGRGGRGDLRTDARGLAPLYSGLHTPDELARLGWLEGQPAALRTAARIFAGPSPWMPDGF